MQTASHQSIVLRGAIVAVLLGFGLCAAGYHSSSPQPAPPLPAGATRIDSSKPPPGMQNTYQQSQAAKSGATPAATPR